jgi:hypothetical protein
MAEDHRPTPDEQRTVEQAAETASHATYQPGPNDLTDEQVAKNQEVVNAAMLYGRRVEEIQRLGDHEFHQFTEYVPQPHSPDTPIGEIQVFARTGWEEILKDGSINRTVKYLNPHDMWHSVQVTSVIKDGVETITGVDGASDLKVGDTRPVPDQVKTAAGLAPQTADPKFDGSFGAVTHPGNASSTGNSSSQSSGGPGEHIGTGLVDHDPVDQAPPDTHDGAGQGLAPSSLEPAAHDGGSDPVNPGPALGEGAGEAPSSTSSEPAAPSIDDLLDNLSEPPSEAQTSLEPKEGAAPGPVPDPPMSSFGDHSGGGLQIDDPTPDESDREMTTVGGQQTNENGSVTTDLPGGGTQTVAPDGTTVVESPDGSTTTFHDSGVSQETFAPSAGEGSTSTGSSEGSTNTGSSEGSTNTGSSEGSTNTGSGEGTTTGSDDDKGYYAWDDGYSGGAPSQPTLRPVGAADSTGAHSTPAGGDNGGGGPTIANEHVGNLPMQDLSSGAPAQPTAALPSEDVHGAHDVFAGLLDSPTDSGPALHAGAPIDTGNPNDPASIEAPPALHDDPQHDPTATDPAPAGEDLDGSGATGGTKLDMLDSLKHDGLNPLDPSDTGDVGNPPSPGDAEHVTSLEHSVSESDVTSAEEHSGPEPAGLMGPDDHLDG